MNNQAAFKFSGEGKTGRFFLSPYHLMEANISTMIQNSRVKRGEAKVMRCTAHKAWGCGCCVGQYSTHVDPLVPDQIDHFREKRGFRRTWVEPSSTKVADVVSYPETVEVNGKEVPFCVSMGIAFGFTKLRA